jgi:hypothetical protein
MRKSAGIIVKEDDYLHIHIGMSFPEPRNAFRDKPFRLGHGCFIRTYQTVACPEGQFDPFAFLPGLTAAGKYQGAAQG